MPVPVDMETDEESHSQAPPSSHGDFDLENLSPIAVPEPLPVRKFINFGSRQVLGHTIILNLYREIAWGFVTISSQMLGF